MMRLAISGEKMPEGSCISTKIGSTTICEMSFLCGKIDNVLTIMQFGEGDTRTAFFVRETVPKYSSFA